MFPRVFCFPKLHINENGGKYLFPPLLLSVFFVQKTGHIFGCFLGVSISPITWHNIPLCVNQTALTSHIVPYWALSLNPLTPVLPVTSLGLSSTSDVITFDQNWHHLYSTSAREKDLSSDRLVKSWNMHKNAQKVERKSQSQISCHYT